MRGAYIVLVFVKLHRFAITGSQGQCLDTCQGELTCTGQKDVYAS
jgi:hypothetical protein